MGLDCCAKDLPRSYNARITAPNHHHTMPSELRNSSTIEQVRTFLLENSKSYLGEHRSEKERAAIVEEALRWRARLSHTPSYQERVRKYGEIIWLRLASSYVPEFSDSGSVQKAG